MFDNDGKTEVIYARDLTLIVADGATGKVKSARCDAGKQNDEEALRQIPPPPGRLPVLCRLRGQGHAGDIVIKDRYEQVFVLTR